MSPDPGPKEPMKKDAEYRKKAYIYTSILLVLGLIGGLLLADRIVTAEANRADPEVEQQQQDSDEQPAQNGTDEGAQP